MWNMRFQNLQGLKNCIFLLSGNKHVAVSNIMSLGFLNIPGPSKIWKGLVSGHFVVCAESTFYLLLRQLSTVHLRGKLRKAVLWKFGFFKKSVFSYSPSGNNHVVASNIMALGFQNIPRTSRIWKGLVSGHGYCIMGSRKMHFFWKFQIFIEQPSWASL